MRLVSIGGEKASLEHLRKWKRHVDENARLINTYGPTETTITTTAHVTSANADCLPIGRPIGNTQAYILDASLEPAPIGVVGELYVGGAGVARGYLNRPELTAEKFSPNPFDAPGRVYRTGDLARWLPDGNIEFVGRADFQVKIRGFRIEPGEIEGRLRQHPAVRDAIVVSSDSGREKRLIAYVVADGQVSGSELRDYVLKRLPEYMTPAAIVFIDRFPLTRNGKVDRKALPPAGPAMVDTSGLVAPRSQAERALAEIWSELLRVPQVGVRDNYFRLGGHSLLAIRVMSRIQETFGIELPMSSLFEAPTIEQLAAAIERQVLCEIEQLTDAEAEVLARTGT
ncbi:MAG: non-ribosomal peptide synthetase [Verrucomicrobia subdivision 3 bacterium]|nr:non-ribosomal peptide synthetase [Limisphaerales bacterium]